MEENKGKLKNGILGFTYWRILLYFVAYSFVGFVLETIYGMITKGVVESRQSFLYGPFCAIYGLGAVAMILALNRFKDNNNRLFIGGFIVGSIIEYVVSWLGELLLHIKWWDYSEMPFNLNGRICAFYSIFWGLLAMYLISYVNPKIDRVIDKVSSKISMKLLRWLTGLSILFLILDCSVTIFALGMFFSRKVYDYDLNVVNKEIICKEYEKISANDNKMKLINRFFNDKKMIRTFPNLKIEDQDGEIIYFQDLVGDIQPYYYKLNEHLRGDLKNTLIKQEERYENVIQTIENKL